MGGELVIWWMMLFLIGGIFGIILGIFNFKKWISTIIAITIFILAMIPLIKEMGDIKTWGLIPVPIIISGMYLFIFKIIKSIIHPTVIIRSRKRINKAAQQGDRPEPVSGHNQ
jgi:hypothetical protein